MVHFGKNGRGVAGLAKRMRQHIEGCGAVVLSDYAKGTLDDIQSLIQLANRYNVPVLVDPKGTDFEKYHGAILITPNLDEFEAVVGACKDEPVIRMDPHHGPVQLLKAARRQNANGRADCDPGSIGPQKTAET